MKKFLSFLMTVSFSSSVFVNLTCCNNVEQKTENKVAEEFDLKKLNQALFTKLQQIIYDQKDKTFKIEILNLEEIEVEQFHHIIVENIKWLISLNSFKITNAERINILNTILNAKTSTHTSKNEDQKNVVIIPLIEAKKTNLAMEMLLFDNLIKGVEEPLIQIKTTYKNIIEKKFTVNIEVKKWDEIEKQVRSTLKLIKQEKLETILNFYGYQPDWKQYKLMIKLAEHIKNNITVEQVKKYYSFFEGQNVQFDLDYSNFSLISKFKLSSYLPEMFNELWIPIFNEKQEFQELEQIIDTETDEEKIKLAIIWIIKFHLNNNVFAIKQEDVEEKLKNNLPFNKAQQFYISDLFFEPLSNNKTAIKIEIDSQTDKKQFNVKITKAQWEIVSKEFKEKLALFKSSPTSNQEYNDIIIKNVTIEKIKAYYDYILEDTHQFIVDFNLDKSLSDQNDNYTKI